jgi:thiamine pyrophosphate-dependent acetolactate synthase large subunit-like protein
MAVQADPATFLMALASAVGGPNGARFSEWARGLKSSEVEKEAANSAKAAEPAFGHSALAGKRLLNPLHLCEAIEAALPDNAILVGDGGDFVATAAYIVRPRAPLT